MSGFVVDATIPDDHVVVRNGNGVAPGHVKIEVLDDLAGMARLNGRRAAR